VLAYLTAPVGVRAIQAGRRAVVTSWRDSALMPMTRPIYLTTPCGIHHWCEALQGIADLELMTDDDPE
jgi:hypothetical protein